MRPGFATFVLLACAAGPALAQSSPKTLDRYAEVGPALLACWKPPAGTEGMEITVIFSFNRSGAVFGKPRITHTKLFGDDDLQKRFVSSALAALSDCTPLKFSDGLGGAVAGRPFSMLFRAVPRGRGV